MLEIVRLDRSNWRISDASMDESNPRRLLGFIERLGRRRFEIVWLRTPIGWAYVPTFAVAVAAIANRTVFSGGIQPERERSLAAQPAPRMPRLRRRYSTPAP